MPEKSWYGVTGWVWSFKWQSYLRHSSYLEREIYIWLDTQPRVTRFQPEPFTIDYRDVQGEDWPYTPDVLVHFVDLPYAVLAEIKWVKDLREQHNENLPKFKAAKAYGAENGMKFTVFTERRIDNHEYRNRKFLRQFLRQPTVATQERQRLLLEALTHAGPSTVNDLLNRLANNRENQLSFLRTTWHLVATGKVTVDLSQPLRRHSIVS